MAQIAGPDRARGIEAVTLAEAAGSEQARTLTPALVEALWSSGLMQYMNPREAGGSEPAMAELIDTWLEMARQDGSFGWIGIANLPSACFAAAYMSEEGFAEVFTANDNRVTLGGQFFPNGMGQAVEGGYRVSGAWQFGSGTGHSEYVCAGFLPMDGEEMRMGDGGMPAMTVAVVPRSEVEFTDGWHVQGLKGTGSYNYELKDVFVPEHRTYPLLSRKPQRGGTLYNFGVMALTGAGHAAWALGVSRSAIDDVVALAKEKVRMGEESSVANKLTFQRDLAHHEAMWRAAYQLVQHSYTEKEQQLAAGAELTPAMRADMRIAATFATEASREIVQFAHLAAGTSAIREGSRLERSFRDMYTGTQHAFISEKTYTEAAKFMLGLIEDSPAL
ncbi:acyl-CoA dehydrogenase [Halioglobus maricola]|uniref:Acyl-CoA dehydrogenase n=2 Tax=Halioglobus maricola TaxID=2601894 RepID=A0A5P9NQB3_9GAMM|nr:acyl-CoA dehydrogenase [Halioglobus maricola]